MEKYVKRLLNGEAPATVFASMAPDDRKKIEVFVATQKLPRLLRRRIDRFFKSGTDEGA